MARHPLLSAEEELELARELRQTGNPDAARRLALANLRLVVKLAREHNRTRRYDLLDLIEEGNLGLLIAVGKFDPERGVKLSTYASWWIRAMIMRFVVDNRRLVRVGTTGAQRRMVFQLRGLRARMAAAGVEPDDGALAAHFGVDVEKLRALESHLDSSELTLDAAPGHGDHPGTRLALLPASAEEAPETLVADEEWRARWRQALASFEHRLDDRDRLVFRARWLEEGQATLQEIGDLLGISRERVRQLEARLLARLRRFLRKQLPDAAAAAAPMPA